MGGPWEKYQAQPQQGPWTKYASPAQATPQLPPPTPGVQRELDIANQPHPMLSNAWDAFKGDIKGLFSNIPTVTSPYPGMDLQRKQDVAQQSAAEDVERQKAGYGQLYRNVAPAVEALGTNVSGMEQAAKEGNPGAVLGHMAAGQATVVGGQLAGHLVGKAIAAPEEIDAFMRRAKSLNDVTKAGTGVYQSEVQPPIQKLQAAIQNEGAKTIQGLIDADKADASVKGSGSIMTASTAAEAAKAIEETGYEPRGAERDILERLTADPTDKIAQGLGYQNADMARARLGDEVWNSTVQKIRGAVPGLGPGGITMDEAVKLRSAVGNALSKASRAGNAKLARILTTSYDELGNAIGDRARELGGEQGTKAWEHYNNEFRAFYELRKGITGDMMQSLEDRHDSIPQLKKFSNADLTEVKEMMQKYGLDPSELDKAQADAKTIADTHGSMMNKQGKSLYRMAQTGGAGALLGIGTYMLARGAGLYGFAPYLAAMYVANMAAGNEAGAMETGRILRKLGHDPEKFQVRTPVEGPQDFHINPDELYQPTKVEQVKAAQSRR